MDGSKTQIRRESQNLGGYVPNMASYAFIVALGDGPEKPKEIESTVQYYKSKGFDEVHIIGADVTQSTMEHSKDFKLYSHPNHFQSIYDAATELNDRYEIGDSIALSVIGSSSRVQSGLLKWGDTQWKAGKYDFLTSDLIRIINHGLSDDAMPGVNFSDFETLKQIVYSGEILEMPDKTKPVKKESSNKFDINKKPVDVQNPYQWLIIQATQSANEYLKNIERNTGFFSQDLSDPVGFDLATAASYLPDDDKDAIFNSSHVETTDLSEMIQPSEARLEKIMEGLMPKDDPNSFDD